MLNIGIVGLGYLGEIHVKCLLELNEVFRIVGVFDINKDRMHTIAKQYNLYASESLDELLEQVEVVDIVCTTSAHYSVASSSIKAGKHVFIEKPVTSSVAEANCLVDLAQEYDVRVQVGHVERFNPAFLAIRKKELNPMFLETHRLANYNPRGNDVSVVRDLMIHDLDIILDIVNAKVRRISASGATVFNSTLDICNAQIEFDNGSTAILSASRVALKNMRKLRFFQPDSYVTVDFLKKEVQWIDKVDSTEVIPPGIQGFEIPVEGQDQKLQFIHTEVKAGNAIKMELADFANAIAGAQKETVSIHDAVRALELADEIEQLAIKRLRQFEKNVKI